MGFQKLLLHTRYLVGRPSHCVHQAINGLPAGCYPSGHSLFFDRLAQILYTS